MMKILLRHPSCCLSSRIIEYKIYRHFFSKKRTFESLIFYWSFRCFFSRYKTKRTIISSFYCLAGIGRKNAEEIFLFSSNVSLRENDPETVCAHRYTDNNAISNTHNAKLLLYGSVEVIRNFQLK